MTRNEEGGLSQSDTHRVLEGKESQRKTPGDILNGLNQLDDRIQSGRINKTSEPQGTGGNEET